MAREKEKEIISYHITYHDAKGRFAKEAIGNKPVISVKILKTVKKKLTNS